MTARRIKFQVETDRVLQILSSEIYDSPYAMLRENIQNAYDAILMRAKADQAFSLSDGRITVRHDAGRLTISDNGIGMTREVIENNYWKAGSSGKRGKLAAEAGVIGTFGIGAMASFGVCDRLEVVTKSSEYPATIVTAVDKSRLDISTECIEYSERVERRSPGTEVFVTLNAGSPFDQAQATRYLQPYVRYLPVSVDLNGTIISGGDYFAEFATGEELARKTYSRDGVELDIRVLLASRDRIAVHASSIRIDNVPIGGDIVLLQNRASVMGLRNYFGLAPVPVTSFYNMGGICNLRSLTPTAGREALSRDSISQAQRLVDALEASASEHLSGHPTCDANQGFLDYVRRRNRLDLAGNVQIEVYPGPESLTLASVAAAAQKKKHVRFYAGSNRHVIESVGADALLAVLSKTNPRQWIQKSYLVSKKVEDLPDEVKIERIYGHAELSPAEFSTLLKINFVVGDDYLIPDVETSFADISHGVMLLTAKEAGKVLIRIARDCAEVKPLIASYEDGRDVFIGIVKDFVRRWVYPQIRDEVPSSTRGGADALRRVLMKNRELYRLEAGSDFEGIETVLSDYLAGKATITQVINAAASAHRSHSHTISRQASRSITDEIPGLDAPGASTPPVVTYEPLPPLVRLDVKTDAKVLLADEGLGALNGYRFFLSLTPAAYKSELPFFQQPHSTRMIWAAHRIIYIFTHASNDLTLYYDIELPLPLASASTGGTPVVTTTIITDGKIFVPVVEELIPVFHVAQGVKEFQIRFDHV